MDWLGIRTDVTPVADIPGAAEAAFGVRLRKAGELQRRWGFLSSSIARQAGPIRYIVSSNRPGNNYITLGIPGSPQGFAVGGWADPWPPPPDGPRRRRPKGDAGDPVAPVINFITADPPDPAAYPAGMVTFTPNITYDGLSGPLIYSWQAVMTGLFAQQAFISGATNNPTAVYDFDAGSFPDNYEALVGLTVSTTFNGFSDNMQYFYVVI